MYSRRNLAFVARSFLLDARPQHFRLGLQINHQVRRGDSGGEHFIIAVVKLQFFVIEIQIREDAVLFQQKIRQHRSRSVAASASRMRFCRSIRKYICARIAEPGFSL